MWKYSKIKKKSAKIGWRENENKFLRPTILIFPAIKIELHRNFKHQH